MFMPVLYLFIAILLLMILNRLVDFSSTLPNHFDQLPLVIPRIIHSIKYM
jgi:hypothetical protein